MSDVVRTMGLEKARTTPEMPFRLIPRVVTPHTQGRAELEYDETVGTPVGPRQVAFRIREGDRPFEAVMRLILLYNEQTERLRKAEEELEACRKKTRKEK